MITSPATCDANATDRATVRDIVYSFLLAKENRTGGLYVRDRTCGGAIGGAVSRVAGRADRRHDGADGACLAEARGLRSERRRAADRVGRPRPAGHLELRDDDAARAVAGAGRESRVHA